MALYAFVALKYRYPLERMLQTIDRHRGYLRELLAQGKMIASGPFVPREGGALLLRVEDESEIQPILDKDPFQIERLVDTTIYKWRRTSASRGSIRFRGKADGRRAGREALRRARSATAASRGRPSRRAGTRPRSRTA